MTLDPLEGMDELQQPITFLETLQRLHALLGERVKVEFNDYGTFFGGGYEGRLEYVLAIPPKDRSIRVVLSGGGGFFVDPDQVSVSLSSAPGLPCLLEFQRPGGPTITLERVSDD